MRFFDLSESQSPVSFERKPIRSSCLGQRFRGYTTAPIAASCPPSQEVTQDSMFD